jgi:hypothetical protein
MSIGESDVANLLLPVIEMGLLLLLCCWERGIMKPQDLRPIFFRTGLKKKAGGGGTENRPNIYTLSSPSQKIFQKLFVIQCRIFFYC